MSVGWPWSELGLDAPADAPAIRRSYADRLRAMDPDADPEGFARLRDAREQALSIARNPAELETVGDDAEWAGGPDRADEASESLAKPTAAAAPVAPASPWQAEVDYEAHYRALLQLLGAHPDEQLTAAEQEALDRHLFVLLNDPRLEEIAFRADAERWWSEVLAQAGGRADPALGPVLDRFGWLRDEGRIDQPAAVAAVVERWNAARYWFAVSTPGHPLHKAWRELTTPAVDGSRRGRFVSGRKVRALLDEVRRDHPQLEGYFDGWRVGLWENPSSGGASGWSIWLMIWLGASVIRVLFGDYGDSTPTPAAPPRPGVVALAEPGSMPPFEQAVAPVLQAFGGDALALAEIERRNRPLYNVLRSNWNIANDAGTDWRAYADNMTRLLNARAQAGVDEADYALVGRLRRIDLAEARTTLTWSAKDCDAYWRGLVRHVGPDTERERQEAIAAVLLSTDVDPSTTRTPGTRRFTISGPVIGKAARRAGLTPDQLGDALGGKGTPATRCAARNALMEVALELPPGEGLKLLRHL